MFYFGKYYIIYVIEFCFCYLLIYSIISFVRFVFLMVIGGIEMLIKIKDIYFDVVYWFLSSCNSLFKYFCLVFVL